MKKMLLAPVFAALLIADAANAREIKTLTLEGSMQTTQDRGLRAETVEVTGRRSPVSVIATDALYGGLAGLAIGGGVALLNSGNDWGRDLAIGAGAGLLIGGIFGAVDAVSSADHYAPPMTENRDRGFNASVAPMSGKF